MALRMPSVFAMAGAAGLVALIGRRLVGTPAGVIGALQFCVLPSTSRYAQETRPYAFAVAGTLLATFLLLRAVDRPSLGRWIGYVAAALFAAVSHIVTVLVLFGHGIAAWRPARPCGPAPFRRWLLAAAAVAAGMVPLALLGSQQTQAIGWITLNRWAVQTLPAALAGSEPVAAALAGAAFVGGCVLAATD